MFVISHNFFGFGESHLCIRWFLLFRGYVKIKGLNIYPYGKSKGELMAWLKQKIVGYHMQTNGRNSNKSQWGKWCSS